MRPFREELFLLVMELGTGSFTGSYDAGGFTISGLHIDLSGGIYIENSTAGLFGRIKSAQVKDLTLTDIKITTVPGVGYPLFKSTAFKSVNLSK